MKCGLLGRSLSHSYSPQIHSLLGNYSYGLFEVEPEDLADFLKNGEFTGINVTLPYKKAVIPYLDEMTPAATAMGSVNTILRRPDGTLLGHNTDCYGFASMLDRTGLAVAGKKVLVLGNGGAGNTAVTVLKERGATTIVISRSGENNYSNLELHRDAALIVNATPVGMYPHTGKAPLDLSSFSGLEGVLDLIYNPARTQILLDAEKLGILTENGLWMLVAQAKEASEYFTGTRLPDAKIREIHRILSLQMQNFILIGMPGCGKSTVGRILADKSGKEFVDADQRITELAGKTIPEIFDQDGEEAFRRWETRVLTELGCRSGLVIATGGGCVTKERNYAPLHQNGTLLWLKRDPSLLPTEGRPLSRAGRLQEMYEIRRPLYAAFGDIEIENSGSPEETADNILSCMEEAL